jgi:hypothetical protein
MFCLALHEKSNTYLLTSSTLVAGETKTLALMSIKMLKPLGMVKGRY